MTEPVYDVVTCGEGVLRLSPPRYERLEQAGLFDVHVAGAALETAVGVQRLGLRTTWLSAVADTPLGDKVVNKVQEHGVDAGFVYRTSEGRTGLCFAEPGSAPRAPQLLYDIDHTAFRTVSPDRPDWSPVARTRIYHIDAVSLTDDPACTPWLDGGLSAASDSTCLLSVCLDVPDDFPPHDASIPRLIRLAEEADMAIITLRTLEKIWEIGGNLPDAASEIKGRIDADVIAVVENRLTTPRAGRWQGVAITDTVHEDRAYEMEVLDAGGTVSAFAAGFLYGYLTETPDIALRYGNAAAALAHSIPGHISWLTEGDLKAQIEGEGARLQR